MKYLYLTMLNSPHEHEPTHWSLKRTEAIRHGEDVGARVTDGSDVTVVRYNVKDADLEEILLEALNRRDGFVNWLAEIVDEGTVVWTANNGVETEPTNPLDDTDLLGKRIRLTKKTAEGVMRYRGDGFPADYRDGMLSKKGKRRTATVSGVYLADGRLQIVARLEKNGRLIQPLLSDMIEVL